MQQPFNDIKINTSQNPDTTNVPLTSLNQGDNQNNKKKSKNILWVFAFISVVMLFFGVSGHFSKASINIYPRVNNFSFKDQSVLLDRDESSSNVHFEVMSLDGYVSSSVHLTNTDKVSKKSSGKVVLYNKETKPYSFSKNTIIKGSNNLNYIILDSGSIPKSINGIPGSVIVRVEAQIPGEDSNADNLDLVFPKFAKTSRSSSIYGRSDGPINGGLSGTIFLMDDGLYKAEVSKLKEQLKDKLFIQAKSEVPDKFILLKDLSFVVLEDLPPILASKNENTEFKLEGKIVAYMLNKKSFFDYIYKQNVEVNKENLLFDIKDLSNLSFNFDPTQETELDLLNVTLNGKGQIIYSVNEDDVKNELLGVSKNNVEKVLEKFPSIESAVTKISPIWQNSLPKDKNRLQIIINPPK